MPWDRALISDISRPKVCNSPCHPRSQPHYPSLPDYPRAMDDLQVRLKFKKNDADDWTKVEDKALRKKLQNRLAKRKSRKFHGMANPGRKIDWAYVGSDIPKSTKNTRERKQKKPGPRGVSLEPPETTSPENHQGAVSPVEPVSDAQALWRITQSLSKSRQRLDSVDLQVAAFFSTPGLSEHRFLCLTQYSLIRAFVQNANILAIEPSSLLNDDALSPWTLANPYPTVAPQDLAPSPVQLCTPHHPYLDIIAPRGLRDNILLMLIDDDLEEQLCYELHLSSFTIWGSQPWNAMGT